MTAIVCLSDIHEHLVDIPACDLLLIAGDISYAFKGDLEAKQEFLLASSPSGSTRYPLTRSCSWPAITISRSRRGQCRTGCAATYLQDAAIELFGLRIWGTPWEPWFVNAALVDDTYRPVNPLVEIEL